MYSHTIASLEKFDNQHDFERMSADILNALGYKDVVLIAPRGGSDGGMDITFSTESREKGLACVTLRKDIDAKFKEDFSKRQAGDFAHFILFCTAYLTATQKQHFVKYCSDKLKAEFIVYDIEALRSLLDSTLPSIREKYLHIIEGTQKLFINAGEIADQLDLASPQNVSQRRLRVFLCHSSGDKLAVRILYQRLKACNVDPWLDEENLLPGQDWEQEIRKAVRASDVVIICLSRSSISKTGFVQKEIKFALDVADEKPEDTIFLIPLKLEMCDIPERLRRWQWVKYFEEIGFNRLIMSLEKRSASFNEKLVQVSIPNEDMVESLPIQRTEEQFQIASSPNQQLPPKNTIDLQSFRENVISFCKQVQITQKELAREIYLDPSELSKRLNGRSPLTEKDVKAIVKALAQFWAIKTPSQARDLLNLMQVSDFNSAEWNTSPLYLLREPYKFVNIKN